MRLTVFDLDHTLLAGDSDYLWGKFMVDEGMVDAEEYERRNAAFHVEYNQGTLDIHAFQRFSQQPLIDQPAARMLALRERFVSERIAPIVAPGAPALIRCHRERGDQLLIITATNRFVTAPIAELLGIPDLLATEPEIVDGAYTGGISGVPCFQDGKITRLQSWLGEHSGFEGIGAYSDSHNDLPLLDYADRPVAVDPDSALAKAASQRGWPIISLREDADGAAIFANVA